MDFYDGFTEGGGLPMRADKDVAELLSGSDRHIKSLVGALRELVHEAVPDAKEVVKEGWRSITYENDGIVCYIAPLKKHVDLGFYEGIRLSDPEKLLEGHGDKLRHLKVWEARDIRREEFKALIREAFAIHSSH